MSTNPEERKFITDDLEIIDLLKYFNKTKEKLWTWQQSADKSGQRPVHFAMVRKVNVIKKYFELIPNNIDGFRFHKGEDIFIYSQQKNIAVKVPIRELAVEYISVPIPARLNILSEELASKLTIVEKEDEESNAHKREAPRKQASGGQLITVEKLAENGSVIVSGMYGLYDISAGGMGFRVDDPATFAAGDIVRAKEIDGKPLKKELEGEVMAVRQLEEEFGTFKVGVKFFS